jgi:small conductance mechanosensitive channel
MIETILNYAKDHAFNVLIIIFVSLVLRKVFVTISNTAIHKSLKIENFIDEREMRQREDTINGIIRYVISIFVYTIGFLLILSELGIDISPLIASAGIAGVALGFGAQTVVKDYLAGFYILAENQYRIGDVVQLIAGGTVTGTVEKITLRQTTLRDLDGQVHYVGNGTIEIATNMTMEHANVNLNIGVDYSTNIEKLEKVINEVGAEIAADPEWSEDIQEAPKFLRVNDFADSFIEIKIVGKTEALKQWAVTGELRKRLKIAFDKNGIVIPFPQVVVHQDKTTKK